MEETITRSFKSIANLVVVASFACLLGSPDVLAQPINPEPPLGTNAPRERAAPVKPVWPKQLPKQVRSVPEPGNLDRPWTDRPSSVAPPPKPRVVVREVARRISVGGGVLVLPEVVYYGAPVILDVPGLGYVEVSEDEYARLYKQLSSPDQSQVDAAIASLREIKAAEDAEVEAARRGSAASDDGRDLSDPITFDRPPKITDPSRRLY
jgi:hypothetical protein